MGIENGAVYLHEVSGNMARELLGCIFYTIMEAGSSSSLNKVVNFINLLTLIFLFCTQPLVLHRIVRGRAKEYSALAANISLPASWRLLDTYALYVLRRGNLKTELYFFG